jgi:hypothetical protein
MSKRKLHKEEKQGNGGEWLVSHKALISENYKKDDSRVRLPYKYLLILLKSH